MVPFALPDIGEAEIREVVEVLRSGWITSGPKVEQFERAFAASLGGEVEAIAVNSATAGLHLALEAAGIGEGDEVVVPVHTFTATAEVVCYVRARPVFVDVEPDTLCLDPDRVRQAITPRTRAIMPVHYGGRACAMQPLIELAREHGLHIVEDAAHALPTTYRGRPIGALPTTATVFSFYATKPLATGEGGMIVTRARELARRMRVMRLHGIDRDVFDRYRRPDASWYYEVIAPGFKYNLTDLAAAIGLVQLARTDAMWRRRRAIAAAYDRVFADLPLRLPAGPAPGDGHAWHLYPVRVADEAPIDRDQLAAALRREGVSTSVHYIPLHLHPFWRDTYGLRPEQFPVATDAWRRLLSLPIYSRMSDAEVTQVIEATRRALQASA
jgi:dTDP-4-amino-4,6-dideoxygalactose transaminase